VSISRVSPDVTVKINGVESNEARVHKVTQVLGSSKVNAAIFEVLGVSTDIIQIQDNDLESLAGQNQLVEIFIDDSALNQRQVFVGRVTGANISFNESGESVTYEARLDPPMFGPVSRTRYVMTTKGDYANSGFPVDFSVAEDSEELVFNPTYAGLYTPNKCAFDVASPGHPFDGKRVFVDPGSVKASILSETREVRNGVADLVNVPVVLPSGDYAICDYWSIQEVVSYLITALGSEDYVFNPTAATIASLDASCGPINNLRIRRGTSLFDALDQVLKPFGYNWRVNFDATFGPTIEIEKRGLASGPNARLISLDRQASGKVGGPDGNTANNLWRFNLSYDMSDKMATTTSLYGANVVKEGTFELVPAWDFTDSNMSTKNSIESIRSNPVEYPGAGLGDGQVWRKWVLNEAGDYTGLASNGLWYKQNDWQNGGNGITRDQTIKSINWKELFYEGTGIDPGLQTDKVRRRTRLLPTVTLNNKSTAPAGQSRGVFVEYGIYNRVSGVWEWMPIESEAKYGDTNGAIPAQNMLPGPGLPVRFRLLEDEAGIYFDGPVDAFVSISKAQADPNASPPVDFFMPRIRVTASIEFSERINSEYIDQNPLPIDNYTRSINSNQYKWRTVAHTGQYASVMSWSTKGGAGGLPDDESLRSGEQEDDLSITIAAQIASIGYTQGTLRGKATLNAVDYSDTQWIGSLIAGINGVNFSMQTNSSASAAPTYPTVTEVTYDINNQTTVLRLGS